MVSSNDPDCGVLYAATDSDLVREATVSAKSLNRHNDLPVTLVTDSSVGDKLSIDNEYFDNVIHLNDTQKNHLDKIAGIRQTPYKRTIYLDTDTYIAGDVSELFDWLNRYDLAAFPQVCHNTNEISGIPNSLKEYCTGVIPYRDDLDTFFNKWYQNLSRNLEVYPSDVAAFRQTIWETDVDLAPLPAEYNCKPRWVGTLHDEVVILHERLLDIETLGAEKRFNNKQTIEKLNNISGNRCHYPSGGLFKQSKEVQVISRKRGEASVQKIPLFGEMRSFAEKVKADGIESAINQAFSYIESNKLRESTVYTFIDSYLNNDIITLNTPVGEISLITDEYDRVIKRESHSETGYEPKLTREILERLDTGDVFYDVGSRFGYYSLLARRIGLTKDQIHTFEASKSNYWYLKQNVGGSAVINRNRIGAGDPDLSLDVYSETNPLPDIVKIDVEGAELNVIKGMKNLLKSGITVYIEVHPQYLPNRDIEKIHSILEDSGYKIDTLDHRDDSRESESIQQPHRNKEYLLSAYT